MKFGAQLELYAIPEWRAQYIAYNELKRTLYRRIAAVVPKKGGGKLAEISRADASAINVDFLNALNDELSKVENHFHAQMQSAIDRMGGVEQELNEIKQGAIHDASESLPQPLSAYTASDGDSQPSVVAISSSKELEERARQRASHKERLANTVLVLWDDLDKIEGFVQLNLLALYKILKKRDKQLGMKNLSLDLPNLRRRLVLLVVPQRAKDVLSELFRGASSSSHVEENNDDHNNEMQNLSILVRRTLTPQNQGQSVLSPWFYVFLGAMIIIIADLIFIALLPVHQDYDMILNVFLGIGPVLRLLLVCILVFWGLGVILLAFELYGVNYKFLLNIEPTSEVNALTMFGVAMILSTLWVLGVGACLIDCKYQLVLTRRTASWVYPLAILLGFVVALSLPSRSFKYAYRRSILKAIWNALRTGFHPHLKVTLMDNLIGDVLTSLAKPLYDLVYTVVFFVGLRFRDIDTAVPVMPLDVQLYLLPAVTSIPYYLRLFQCCNRIRLESASMKRVHLANVGKYSATASVIIASNIKWERLGLSIYAARLIFVFTYLFASLYNLIWDVTMDWGLLPDPDHFVRPDQRILYPQWMYHLISILNIFGRLTWAVTLIPINLLDDYRLNVFLITVVISVLEVLRRSAWSILRLENEHLTNSSRYRAMLWVPQMAPSAATRGNDLVTSRLNLTPLAAEQRPTLPDSTFKELAKTFEPHRQSINWTPLEAAAAFSVSQLCTQEFFGQNWPNTGTASEQDAKKPPHRKMTAPSSFFATMKRLSGGSGQSSPMSSQRSLLPVFEGSESTTQNTAFE